MIPGFQAYKYCIDTGISTMGIAEKLGKLMNTKAYKERVKKLEEDIKTRDKAFAQEENEREGLEIERKKEVAEYNKTQNYPDCWTGEKKHQKKISNYFLKQY